MMVLSNNTSFIEKTVMNLPRVGNAKETTLTAKICNAIFLIDMICALIGLDVVA